MSTVQLFEENNCTKLLEEHKRITQSTVIEETQVCVYKYEKI